MDGSRGLQCILQRLPSTHPALIWTNGSVLASYFTRQHHYCNMKLSSFHHRSIHNIQHTLPSFRRPNGISLYKYIDLSQAVAIGNKSDKTNCHCSSSACKKCAAKIQTRNLHSEKQLPYQKPFMLSPQGLLAASPESVQPYLRLIRFDRPIGKI